MTLCLIPARGGSKRIPRKNVRPLAGRPLMLYTVEAARASNVFDRIVVSSDDEEVLQLATEAGVVADRRPDVLAGDRVAFVDVLKEYLARSPNEFTAAAVLLPTCPFRTEADIRAVFTLHGETGQTVMAVTTYEFPPQFALKLGADGRTLSMEQPEVYRRSTQSQSVEAAYHPNGAIYLGNAATFLMNGTFFADPMTAYLMPRERSIDIDFPEQWAAAESLMRQITWKP